MHLVLNKKIVGLVCPQSSLRCRTADPTLIIGAERLSPFLANGVRGRETNHEGPNQFRITLVPRAHTQALYSYTPRRVRSYRANNDSAPMFRFVLSKPRRAM